jgi:two-component system chemotaxis sensor kinase CheA
MDQDEQFRQHLLATFKVEAGEHINAISSGLLALEKSEDMEKQAEIVETVFRAAHSLKGAARAVNLKEIEGLCQNLESVFNVLKKRELVQSVELFDLLQQVLNLLEQLLSSEGAVLPAETGDLERELIRRLEAFQKGVSPSPVLISETPLIVPEKEPAAHGVAAPVIVQEHRVATTDIAETVRISMAKLTSVLLQAEEMLAAKLAAQQRCIDMRAANGAFRIWEKEWARVAPCIQDIRKNTTRAADDKKIPTEEELVRAAGKILDFLEWNREFVKSIKKQYVSAAKSGEGDSLVLGGMVDNLLDDVKKAMIFPFSSLLELYPKVARELARDSGKELELVIKGGDIEIDRRILDEMKDPILHLLRNCVDHAIEKPEERIKKDKPPHGTVIIEIYPKDNKVEVTIADDGIGISPDQIRTTILKLGVVAQEKTAELTDKELLSYVFQSGVSTSPIITDLSGRGLGLAIVKEKVEKLGGTVSLESKPGIGTIFHMVLPITVATFRGVLVKAGEHEFILPTMYVERAARIRRDEIKTVESRETIVFNESPVALASLASVLELATAVGAAETQEQAQVVVVSNAGIRIAFLVDEIVNEQEVLLKPLGPQLVRVRNMAGATILGTGRMVPVINVPDLLRSAVKASGPSLARITGAGSEDQEDIVPKHSVLVVEDSITTRTLLKNILETAGYDVVTAIDGLDALTNLKTRTFDIVVSDVDMPRMNGFDLTAKIRSDQKMTDMPVILVTALESLEDRERGIDAGANAYIVKSSFDQSNLLGVIHRLIIEEN